MVSQHERDGAAPPRFPAGRQTKVMEIEGKVVFVGFPVVLPGEDARVIPFGRYSVATPRQRANGGAPSAGAVLVNRDSGARIVLSAHQLDAVARDPDVEIF